MKQLPHWVLTDTFPAFYDSESLTAVQQTARVYAAVQELIDEYNKFVDEINAHIDEYEHNKDAQMDCFIEKITQTMNSYIESIDMKADSQNLKIAQAIEEMRLAYQTFEASMNDKQQGFEDEITERQTAFETDLTNKFETLVADIERLMAAFSKALIHAIENEGNHFIVGTDSQGVSYDYADTVPSYGVDLTGQTLVNLLPATNNTFISDTTIQNETSVNINLFKASTTYTVFLNDSTSKVTSLVIGGDVELLNTAITNKVFTFSTASSIDSTLDYYVKFYASESNIFVAGDESNISCIIIEGDHTDKDISYFEGLKSVGETNGNQIVVTSKSEDETQVSTATITLSEPLRSLPNGVKDIAEWKNDKVIVTRHVGQVVLDGSGDWSVGSTTSTGGYYRFYTTLGDIKSGVKISGLCDRLPYTDEYWGEQTYSSFQIGQSNNSIYLFYNDISTIDELKTRLSTTPITVTYELATPTTEEYDVAAPELYQHVFIETGVIPTQETTHRVILNMSDQITSNTQTIVSLEQRVAQLETLAVTTLPLESEGDL